MAKTIRTLLLLVVLIALFINLLADDEVKSDETRDEKRMSSTSFLLQTSRGFSNSEKPRRRMTCDRRPKLCHTRGSPGRSCCKKRCVNVQVDALNCGRCGNKCSYSEICCKGKCVNPMWDKKHCGGCRNKCMKGSKCVYGMCSYA